MCLFLQIVQCVLYRADSHTVSNVFCVIYQITGMLSMEWNPRLDLKHLQNLDPKPQRISKIVPKPQQGMQECL